MKVFVNCSLIIYYLIFGSLIATASEEVVVWKSEPIKFYLQIGQQRALHFPGAVWVDMPDDLVSLIDVQLLGSGVTYWTARERFSPRTIRVISIVDSTEYLIEVRGIDEVNNNSKIIIKNQVVGSIDNRRKVPSSNSVSEVDLMRYVASRVLNEVPIRLHPNIPNVRKIAVEHKPRYLYESGEFKTVPVLQYKSPGPNSFYVTAVKFINMTLDNVYFDPRYVTGDILYTSPLNEYAFPAGNKWDTLIVLYVTRRSFQESIAMGALNSAE